MAEPFLGEIKIVSFGFPPKGWALCNGQLLPINQNQALFSLLGTTYGGDGRTTFALPNLQGRAPVHRSSTWTQGQLAGEETHTLTSSEMPVHAHTLTASRDFANSTDPTGNVLGAKAGRFGKDIYAPATSLTALAPASIDTAVGGAGPHNNLQPYLTLNFVIALIGIFPSQN
jgi:microcystin-dependent protein